MATFVTVFLDDAAQSTLEAVAHHRTQAKMKATVRLLAQEAVDRYVASARFARLAELKQPATTTSFPGEEGRVAIKRQLATAP